MDPIGSNYKGTLFITVSNIAEGLKEYCVCVCVCVSVCVSESDRERARVNES